MGYSKIKGFASVDQALAKMLTADSCSFAGSKKCRRGIRMRHTINDRKRSPKDVAIRFRTTYTVPSLVLKRGATIGLAHGIGSCMEPVSSLLHTSCMQSARWDSEQ